MSLVLCLLGGLGAAAASPSPMPDTRAPATAATPAATSATIAPTPDAGRIAAAAAGLSDLIDPLVAGRLLLIELRKDLPSTRGEAERYLARVEDLALATDPARLGVMVSRLREAVPVFLDWRDQRFSSQAEASTAYLESGAAAFDATWSTLQDAILLSIADRIDTIVGLVDEMQGDR